MNAEIEAKPLSGDFYYIEGLRYGRKTVLNDIYRKYYPRIQSLIVSNSGTLEDAKDIFQDTLIAVYYNVKDKNFQLTCQFSTYLYSVSHNLWLKHLRNRKFDFTDITGMDMIMETEEAEEVTLKFERYKLYQRVFKEIGLQCQRLLMRFMQGADMKTLAKEFGFASVSYAKKRKFQCKENLISRIEEDEEYKKVKIRE